MKNQLNIKLFSTIVSFFMFTGINSTFAAVGLDKEYKLRNKAEDVIIYAHRDLQFELRKEKPRSEYISKRFANYLDASTQFTLNNGDIDAFSRHRTVLNSVIDFLSKKTTSEIQIQIYKNGKLVIEKNPSFKVGDEIKLTVIANDPKGLPIRYRFIRFVNGGGEDFFKRSENNSVVYTITEEDLLNSTGYWIEIENNDGKVGSNGDDYLHYELNVSDGVERLDAKIKGTKLTVNGSVVKNGHMLKVGDEIKLTVIANDPKGLPIRYRFIRFVNGGGEDFFKRSENNSVVYTITEEDLLNSTGYWIEIENNDGKVGSNGDDYLHYELNVSDAVERLDAEINKLIINY